jgi:flagellar biosynthesis protein FlhB
MTKQEVKENGRETIGIYIRARMREMQREILIET